jgi:hypothetical protein
VGMPYKERDGFGATRGQDNMATERGSDLVEKLRAVFLGQHNWR